MAALRLYQLIVFLAGPVLRCTLVRRAARGREDPARLRERFGRASLKRPKGPLVWLHAASVGETNSVLPLIKDILTSRPAQYILLTTGTVTSACVVARWQTAHPNLRAQLKHQFAPLDRRAWVNAFLDHWQPDAGFWVESEIWPNMILAGAERNMPMVMLNGRMSPFSFRRWKRIAATTRHLLIKFDLLMAQDAMTAERLTALGLSSIAMPGNLKLDAPPLPYDATELARLQKSLGTRPRWLAASTHAGEETEIAAAHQMIAAVNHDVLTLIAPRHPDRGKRLARELRHAGYAIAQRSQGEAVTPQTQIYLLDTLGELGLFYRLCKIVLMGGSLIPHGGQNPIEAAQLNCAILHGSHVANFQQMFDALAARQATAGITDAPTLAAQVKALLQNPASGDQMAMAAQNYASEMTGTRARVLALLADYLASPDTIGDMEQASATALEAHDG